MTDVSRLLDAVQVGDRQAAVDLFPLVYDELRKLAAARMSREAPNQTLQATALVHEAYMRLVGSGPQPIWDSRGHFFAAAAEAMRRILVEGARRKQTIKRGGHADRHSLEDEAIPVPNSRGQLELLTVHEALDGLAAKSPRKAELVKLRYFLGCTISEAAEILGIAPATAEDDWTYAKAWLRRQLGSENLSKN